MKNIRKIIREAIDEITFDNRYKQITNFDDPSYADDARWDEEGVETPERQEIESDKTSLKQIPYTFRTDKGITWTRGHHNLDIGGGAYDLGTEELMKREGVVNLIFDPYNRNPEFNHATLDKVEEIGGADSITVNSCLNVIKGRPFIEQVIHQAADAIKPDGKVIFKIHPGDTKDGKHKSGDGIPRKTKNGYQQFKKACKYVPLIRQYFEEVYIDKSNDVIIAMTPKYDATNKANFYPDKDGDPRQLNIQRENKIMKSNKIKITESQLKQILQHSIKTILEAASVPTDEAMPQNPIEKYAQQFIQILGQLQPEEIYVDGYGYYNQGPEYEMWFGLGSEEAENKFAQTCGFASYEDFSDKVGTYIEDLCLNVKFELDYNVDSEPYEPETYYEPASGGEVWIREGTLKVSINEAKIQDGTHELAINPEQVPNNLIKIIEQDAYEHDEDILGEDAYENLWEPDEDRYEDDL